MNQEKETKKKPQSLEYREQTGGHQKGRGRGKRVTGMRSTCIMMGTE